MILLENDKVLWQEKKKLIFGLPWTFTTYTLTEDALKVKTGVVLQRFEEIKLYKVRDFTVVRNPIQRLFKLGTIHICSVDNSSPEYDVINIYNAIEVKDMMSRQVDISKEKHGVTELLGNYGGLH